MCFRRIWRRKAFCLMLSFQILLMWGCGKDSVPDKTETVVYAGINIDPHLMIQADQFNQSQKKYEIQIVDYGGYENPVEKLDLDIVSGNVPDMIALSYLDYHKYIQKGLLCDLKTFLEKDPELSEELFFENVLQAMETDGKLYYLMPYYTIGGLMGRKEDTEQNKNLQEMMHLEKQYGEDASAFYFSNESILRMLCEADPEAFVDWENGECRFDGEEFKQILEYAAAYPTPAEVMQASESRVQQMLEHKILYCNVSGIADFSTIIAYREIFGEDAGFIGYPSAQKSGGSINPAMASFSVGISSQSDKKEGAWEFLKILMSREYCVDQAEEYFADGFPLRKDVFLDIARKYTTKEPYVDDFGHSIEPVDGNIGMDGLMFETKPLKEEDIDYIKDEIIAKADHCGGSLSPVIWDIIREEANKYFEQIQGEDDTIRHIQSRAGLYMSEQK